MIAELGSQWVVPFELDTGDGFDLSRVGGRAPAGITPGSKSATYLITVQLEESTFVSLFLNQDMSYFLDTADTMQGEGGACEVFFHEKTPRRTDDLYHSGMSAHALAMEPGVWDITGGGYPEPLSGCKIGGTPFLITNKPRKHTLIAQLTEAGFVQFLQVDISMLGGPRAKFTYGGLPFGPGSLHLYLKPPLLREWRCFWQFG